MDRKAYCTKNELKEEEKKMSLTREQMANRAAKELKNGYIVNLGIGMPTMVANYIPENINVMLHSENGVLGMGPFPYLGKEDADLINAGKETITIKKGASYFSSSESFSMIRNGYIDLAILGAMQVSENADIANWLIPGKMVKGMGGAMDLVAGSKRIVVIMDHFSKNNKPKILKKCTLPLTGKNCVDLIITNLGVFLFKKTGGLHLIEVAKNTSVEYIKKNTECAFTVDEKIKII